MPDTYVISGANRGIGLALAEELANRGHRIFAGTRHIDYSHALQKLCQRHPGAVTAISLDITRDASVETAVAALYSASEHVDVLVNNAAVFPEEGHERIDALDLRHFSTAFETNVVGTARLTRALLPLLRKSKRPRIANISSGAGSIGEKTDSHYYAYSTSKAALNMLTRAIAAELRNENIVVAAVSPGWVKTEMGGANAEITAEESARALSGMLENLDLSKTGKFLSRDGSEGKYVW